jgi:hypothetical protein
VAWHPKTKRARLRQVPRVEQGGLCHGRHPARVAEVSCGAVSGRRAMPVNVWLSIISAVGAVSAVAAHLLIASGYYGRLTQKVEDHDDRLGTAEAQLRDHETSSARGRAFTAQKAVKLGLADRVGTLDDALAKHGATRPVGARGSLFSGGFHAGEAEDSLATTPASEVQDRRQNPHDDDPENVDDQGDNKMDFGDGDSTCECACSACKEGACDACSCNACACDQTTSAHKKAAANRRRLQLAEL